MIVPVAGWCSMSSGMDRNTGPLGGVPANFKARRVASGTLVPVIAVHCHLLIGTAMSFWKS